MKTNAGKLITSPIETSSALFKAFSFRLTVDKKLQNKIYLQKCQPRIAIELSNVLGMLTFFCNAKMAIPIIAIAIPEITTGIPEITTAIPCIATAIPFITTTNPSIATAIPFIATTNPSVTTAIPNITTAIPCITTAISGIATAIPCITTTISGIATAISEIAKNALCIMESRNQNQHYKLPLPNT